MSTSLPKLRRAYTPARNSRPLPHRSPVQPSSEGHRATSSEAKSFLSAVGLGMRESVQDLIRQRKVDFRVKDPRGFNCVQLAVKRNDVQLLELLCERCHVPPGDLVREELNITAVHKAAKAGSLNALQYLIERARVSGHAKDTLGRNAVFYAAAKGHLDCVVYLVTTAKVSVRGVQKNTGDTVLHVAAKAGHLQLCKWLVEKMGLDPHVFNNASRNALHLAVKANSLELVKYFHYRKDVNPFQPDNKNMNAVGYSALDISHLPVFKYFLRQLGVTAILLGDPNVTRSLWTPPPTAYEVASSQHNTAALACIKQAKITHSRVVLTWICATTGKIPSVYVMLIAEYI